MRRNPVLAVLGTDGAGKSTLLEKLVVDLSSEYGKPVVLRHLRPGLLPPLARLKGKVDLQIGPVTDPHGSSPSGLVGSMVRLAYLLIDYTIGYWWRTRRAGGPAIHVFDRYIYDIAIDPRRFRIQLPERFLWTVVRRVPRPDVIICLVASPEVVHSRKRELPIEEVRRQVASLERFAARESRAVVIDANPNPERVRERTLEEVRQRLDGEVAPHG